MPQTGDRKEKPVVLPNIAADRLSYAEYLRGGLLKFRRRKLRTAHRCVNVVSGNILAQNLPVYNFLKHIKLVYR